jgi:hypothetical protein
VLWGYKLNSKGVTLVELLMYVVLVVIVMALVAKPLQKMLKKSTSESQQSSLQSSSRDVISMMSREIRNTGFKRYIFSPGGTYTSAVINNSFLTADSSSFILRPSRGSDFSDTLTIYKATVDNTTGFSTGGVDSIKYYLKSDTLKRKLGTTEISLASNVIALQFMLGQLATDSLLYSADVFSTGQWTKSGVVNSIALSGSDLAVNYSGNGNGAVALSTANTFTINSASRIKLTYNITNGTGVTSFIDSLKWSILNSAGTIVASDYFKPGFESGSMILTVKSAVPAARVELGAVCKGISSLIVTKIEIRKIDLGAIQWSDTVAVNKKKYVKAIKIIVLQRSTNKADSYTGGSVKVGDITVPRSDEYGWRLLNETVEIPNNGLF